MKYEVGTVLEWLPGGNKYLVKHVDPTPGPDSDIIGLYGLECVDFWCSEEFTDGKTCTRLGQLVWETFQAVDLGMQVNTGAPVQIG